MHCMTNSANQECFIVGTKVSKYIGLTVCYGVNIRSIKPLFLVNKMYIVYTDRKDTEMIITLVVCPLKKMPLRQGRQNRNRNHLVKLFQPLLHPLLQQNKESNETTFKLVENTLFLTPTSCKGVG